MFLLETITIIESWESLTNNTRNKNKDNIQTAFFFLCKQTADFLDITYIYTFHKVRESLSYYASLDALFPNWALKRAMSFSLGGKTSLIILFRTKFCDQR